MRDQSGGSMPSSIRSSMIVDCRSSHGRRFIAVSDPPDIPLVVDPDVDRQTLEAIELADVRWDRHLVGDGCVRAMKIRARREAPGRAALESFASALAGVHDSADDVGRPQRLRRRGGARNAGIDGRSGRPVPTSISDDQLGLGGSGEAIRASLPRHINDTSALQQRSGQALVHLPRSERQDVQGCAARRAQKTPSQRAVGRWAVTGVGPR